MFSKRPKGATINNDNKNNGMASLLWMLFGAIVTIAVGVFAYKSPMFGFNDSESEAQLASDEPTVKPKIATDKDNENNKDNENYKFYDILPEQEMTAIPEKTVTPTAVEKTIENKAKNFRPDIVVTGNVATDDSLGEATDNPSVNNQENSSDTANSTSDNTNSENQQTNAHNTTVNADNGNVDKKASTTAKSSTASTDNSGNSSKNKHHSQNKNPTPAGESGEMVIVYENTTYDGATPKAEKRNTSAQNNTNTRKNTAQTKESSSSSTAKSKQTSNHTASKTEAASINHASHAATEKPSKQTLIINETKSVNTKSVAEQKHTQSPSVASKPTANKPSKSYILQINSFDSADEADRRRAQVLMAGVDAHVVKNNASGGVVYQVLSNAMSTPEAIIRAQQNLQKSGIDSIIVEQRRK